MSFEVAYVVKNKILHTAGAGGCIYSKILFLGKSIFLDYLQFILAIQATKRPFRAAYVVKNTFSGTAGVRRVRGDFET